MALAMAVDAADRFVNLAGWRHHACLEIEWCRYTNGAWQFTTYEMLGVTTWTALEAS